MREFADKAFGSITDPAGTRRKIIEHAHDAAHRGREAAEMLRKVASEVVEAVAAIANDAAELKARRRDGSVRRPETSTPLRKVPDVNEPAHPPAGRTEPQPEAPTARKAEEAGAPAKKAPAPKTSAPRAEPSKKAADTAPADTAPADTTPAEAAAAVGVPAEQPAAETPPAAKQPAKKAPAKKEPAAKKQPAAKKEPAAKKTPSKKTAKKAPAAEKAPANKAPTAKKTTAKKTAPPAKKTTKKEPAKEAPANEAPAAKKTAAPETVAEPSTAEELARAEDTEVTTPAGTTGAGEGFNPDTGERDLDQPGTEGIVEESTTKETASKTDTLRKAAESSPTEGGPAGQDQSGNTTGESKPE